MGTIKNKYKEIKYFFFDVDGVLTDGSVTLIPNAGPVRKMSSKDGYALQLAIKKGYHICIITGGNSPQVKDVLSTLGIEHIYLNSRDKLEVFEEHCLAFDIPLNECIYMGDDIPDYEVMNVIGENGLSCCPNDAAKEIQSLSQYVSPFNGGKGCVRDVIEQILKMRGDWFEAKVENSNFKEYTW